MRILLTQAEILSVLQAHVASIIPVADGTTTELTAFLEDGEIVAEISIVPSTMVQVTEKPKAVSRTRSTKKEEPTFKPEVTSGPNGGENVKTPEPEAEFDDTPEEETDAVEEGTEAPVEEAPTPAPTPVKAGSIFNFAKKG